MDWTMPARPLSPPDKAEEHEYERCEECGCLIEPVKGCYCTWVDMELED